MGCAGKSSLCVCLSSLLHFLRRFSWFWVVGSLMMGWYLLSFYSPNSLLLGVLNALKNGRLGAGWSGRVPGRLVSHFLICLPVLFICFPGWVLACLRLPFICFPLLFICLPLLFNCLQFFSFVSQAGCLWSGSRLACLPLPFICLPLLFICLPLLFIVSQGRCLWSGSRPACLPLPFICLPLLFICLPGWVLVVGFPAGLSPTSFVVGFPAGFLSFVSHFFSGWVLLVRFPAGLSPTSFHLSPFICLPLLFICLPGWVLVVGFPAGLPPTSLHLSPTFSPTSLLLGVLNSFLRCVRPLCHCWCPSISIHLSPRSVTAGVRPFPVTMQHF